MGLAPTEKHIEDWIVGNFDEFKQQTMLPAHRIIARQAAMPSGIADLVMWLTLSLTVVEIKKGNLDAKAVSQMERYTADIRHLHSLLYDEIHLASDLHAHDVSMFNTDVAGGRAPIHGILIGNSIDNQTLIHCQSNNFEVVLYDYEDGVYTFSRDPFMSVLGSLEEYNSNIVDATRQLMRHLKLFRDDQETLKSIYYSEGLKNE